MRDQARVPLAWRPRALPAKRPGRGSRNRRETIGNPLPWQTKELVPKQNSVHIADVRQRHSCQNAGEMDLFTEPCRLSAT
jgi:hypothetical protein